MKKALMILVLLVSFAAILSACSGEGAEPEAAPAPTTAPAAPQPTTPPAAAPAPTTPPAAPAPQPTSPPAAPAPSTSSTMSDKMLVGVSTVDTSITMVPAPAQYNEAPMLAEMVASGDLPPVEERLPDEPLVIQVQGSRQVWWHASKGAPGSGRRKLQCRPRQRSGHCQSGWERRLRSSGCSQVLGAECRRQRVDSTSPGRHEVVRR